MKNLMIIILVMLLLGCDYENNELALMPLYQGCEKYIERYEKKLDYDSLKFSTRFFDEDLIAAPGVIGYLSITGSNVSEFEVDVIKNGLKLLCYPMNSTTVSMIDNEYFSILMVFEVLQSNYFQKGIEYNYMFYNPLKKNVKVYYNGSSNETINDILN